MSTTTHRRTSNHIIGRATVTTITRKCGCCQESFTMTCEDYALNLGAIIKESKGYGADGWICPDCVEEIIRIKNL